MASTVRTSWVAYVCVGLLVGCTSRSSLSRQECTTSTYTVASWPS